MSTKNEPKFEFRAPKAGEWYLHVNDMAVPLYTDETLDTKQWVIVKPDPEPKHPTADVIRITGIDPSHPFSDNVPLLAIRQDGVVWYCTSDRFIIDPEQITAWEEVVTWDGDA